MSIDFQAQSGQIFRIRMPGQVSECKCVSNARSVLPLKSAIHLQRMVNVPASIGYGDQGLQEIPPGATVQLNIELLKVLK